MSSIKTWNQQRDSLFQINYLINHSIYLIRFIVFTFSFFSSFFLSTFYSSFFFVSYFYRFLLYFYYIFLLSLLYFLSYLLFSFLYLQIYFYLFIFLSLADVGSVDLEAVLILLLFLWARMTNLKRIMDVNGHTEVINLIL